MVLYLLSKEDFATLYKFGKVSVKYNASAESDDEREAVHKILWAADNFEYPQERIIVASQEGTPDSVEMKNIVRVYPLDRISKNLFEGQFNKDIIFEEPIFEDLVLEFLHTGVVSDVTLSGINALRQMFGFEMETDKDLIDDIVRGKKFLRNYKYYDVPLEQRTPYSMLVAYNRYRHYPNDSRGYFYDAADCFLYGYMYSKLSNQADFLGFDESRVQHVCSAYFQILDEIPSGEKFPKILDYIDSKSPKIKGAIEEVYGSIKFMALYFYLKEKIRRHGVLTPDAYDFLKNLRNYSGDDFPKLLTLLGGYFGYTWLYDLYYRLLKLPVIRNSSPAREVDNGKIKDEVKDPSSADTNTGAGCISKKGIVVKDVADVIYARGCKGKDTLIERLELKKDVIVDCVERNAVAELEKLFAEIVTDKKKSTGDIMMAFVKACFNSITDIVL